MFQAQRAAYTERISQLQAELAAAEEHLTVVVAAHQELQLKGVLRLLVTTRCTLPLAMGFRGWAAETSRLRRGTLTRQLFSVATCMRNE